MAAPPSPYVRAAGRLRDMGYHAMPAKPGEKAPGHFEAGRWSHMARWQDWCGRMPPAFLHERWEEWADAGVCVAHGAVIGADVDTDRKDVADAVVAALGPSPVRRRGRKGWMGYYRPGSGCEGLGARLRWYDPDICSIGEDGGRSWPPLVELLLHGAQSIVPPTIHPDTGQPYHWLTPDTLEDTPLGDLPELPADPVGCLDAALANLGLTRVNPNGKASAAGHREPTPVGAHDLEKPRFRSMNDRALATLDRWFPALGLPRTRQRGAGAWEAVAAWRSSSSGRPLEKRGANLHASPGGIRDFGDGAPYTAIDLVIAARGCSFDAAVDWLEPFLDPEPRVEVDLDAIAAAAERRRTAAAETAERASPFYRARELHGIPVPAREWHVEGIIPANQVTILGGDGGVGKSLLALQLAVATAAGRCWIGRQVREGPALYLSAEDDRDELHRRLADIATAEGLTFEHLDNLVLRSLAGEDALLAMLDRKTGALATTPLLDELDARIAEERPALVLLDTLADLHSGDENVRSQARQFIGILRGLAIRHSCAVLLLAHPSLSGMANGSGSSGSTAWNASVRSRLYLDRIVEDGYEPDADRRRLTVKKSNYGRTSGEIDMTWRSGVFVPDAPQSSLDRTAVGLRAERVFLQLLRRHAEQGRRVSAQPGPTYAPSQFATHADAEGCTKRVFKVAMDKLFEAGRLRVAEHGSGAKARTHIVEVNPNEE